MKHYAIRSSLKNKLLASFLFVGVLPSFLLGFFIYSSFLQNMERSVKNTYTVELSGACEFLEDSLQSAVQAAQNQPQDQAISILNALPFVADVWENELPQTNMPAIEKQIHGTPVWFTMDLDYLKKMFSKNLNDKGEVEISNSRLIGEKQDSQAFIVCSAELFENQLTVTKLIDRQDVLFEVHKWGEISVRLTMIMIIASVCFAIGLSYQFSYGVDKLINEMKRVRKGDFSQIDTVKGNDEIALLSNSFRKMTAELDVLLNKTYRLKLSEREAHIKALQSQISPHFLYNALDSINWSLLQKGDFETSTILIALSETLRYSIDDAKRMVTLEEELHQVQNYLKIQKSRFGDRFDYEVEPDEDTLTVMVPKMIIQPLVENAISHGLEDHTHGELLIRTYPIDAGIEIEVYDTGRGIPKEQLDYICREMDENPQISEEKEFHLGVANVNNRLQYIYGKNSRLLIDSMENEYTKVILHIELEEEQHEDIGRGR